MTKHGLDSIDRTLLSLLQENSRQSTAELARKLDLSRSTVQDRIARLEKDGVIQGYTVRLAVETQAAQIRAHIALTVEHRLVDHCVQALRSIPEVRTVFAATGPYSLLVLVGAPTTQRLDAIIDQVGKLPGVSRATAAIIMSVRLDRR
jgi:DNA-binding Lrp family transcriptional regulator